MSKVIIMGLFLILNSCVIIGKDSEVKVLEKISYRDKAVKALNRYKERYGVVMPYKISSEEYERLIKIDKNFDNVCSKLEDEALCRHTPYSSNKKYIIDFSTRPGWEFSDIYGLDDPNYQLVYFSEDGDREKCGEYLSKKHKPLGEWYYTSKFWSLKKCLGIEENR